MGDVIEEMGQHLSETFFRLYIFLPTNLAVAPGNGGAAV